MSRQIQSWLPTKRYVLAASRDDDKSTEEATNQDANAGAKLNAKRRKKGQRVEDSKQKYVPVSPNSRKRKLRKPKKTAYDKSMD
mmetsp:Transcript_30249/g.64101  ORF Transcript_30249/g.64101 Transcript_30249/m.64101 type:complete len:84 (-) Transcript_30249:1219-1470(-)